MTQRLTCLVPFCRRTHANAEGYEEWICAMHWRLTNRTARRRYMRWLRRGAALLKIEPTPDDFDERARLQTVLPFMWERLKKQAIERSAGI